MVLLLDVMEHVLDIAMVLAVVQLKRVLVMGQIILVHHVILYVLQVVRGHVILDALIPVVVLVRLVRVDVQAVVKVDVWVVATHVKHSALVVVVIIVMVVIVVLEVVVVVVLVVKVEQKIVKGR